MSYANQRLLRIERRLRTKSGESAELELKPFTRDRLIYLLQVKRQTEKLLNGEELSDSPETFEEEEIQNLTNQLLEDGFEALATLVHSMKPGPHHRSFSGIG